MRKIKRVLFASAFMGLQVFLAGNVSAKDGSWSKITDVTQRYQVLSNFGGAAVMDRETGLIWEQCPSTEVAYSWADAKNACYFKNVGGRLGWRLPTFEELTSLGDPAANPFLPNSHGFCSTASAACIVGGPPGCDVGPAYWTATGATGEVFIHAVKGSSSDFHIGLNPSSGQEKVWCVRTGQYRETVP